MLLKYKNVLLTLLRLKIHSVSKIVIFEQSSCWDIVHLLILTEHVDDHHLLGHARRMIIIYFINPFWYYLRQKEAILQNKKNCIHNYYAMKNIFYHSEKIYICIFKMFCIICWHFELLETVLICAQYVFGCNTVIYVGNFQNTDRINF